MVQLMPLPLTVSCFSKIQIGFTFLVLAYPGSPRQRAVKRVCVCVCVTYLTSMSSDDNSGFCAEQRIWCDIIHHIPVQRCLLASHFKLHATSVT